MIDQFPALDASLPSNQSSVENAFNIFSDTFGDAQNDEETPAKRPRKKGRRK